MNLEKARFAMVDQQIRTWGVSNRRVLDALLAIPREAFVPPEYLKLSYADTAIPLADGQEMIPPRIAGRILQALALGPTDHVLEVGTGSGYLTALLAMLAKKVISVEISPILHQRARAALAGQNVRNARVLPGDGTSGQDDGGALPEKAGPFDAIAVTGSVPTPPAGLRRRLKQNGRLFAVVGKGPVMEARLITRTGPDDWREEGLFETDIPPIREAGLSVEAFVL